MVDQVAGNQVIISRLTPDCFALRGHAVLYFYILLSLRYSFTFVYSCVRELRMTILFGHIIHGPHNMFRFPPGMLDKPNMVQRMQGAHEPRLHMHLPLFLLTVPLSLISRCQVTPLGLDYLRERLVPVVHIDHASRLEVSPEEDAHVRQFPYGQARRRRRVIARQRKESVRLEKRRNDGSARSGVEHLWRKFRTIQPPMPM